MNIVATETIYIKANCSAGHSFYSLETCTTAYLAKYPFCPQCGIKLGRSDIVEHPEIVGATVQVLVIGGKATADFKITSAALNLKNIRETLDFADARITEV